MKNFEALIKILKRLENIEENECFFIWDEFVKLLVDEKVKNRIQDNNELV